MRLGVFLFHELRNPSLDGQVIGEAVHEAQLAEEQGMDAVFLAEHHFDGNCVYVDPPTFASALAMVTNRIKIGFAVLQTSLYHPVADGRAAVADRQPEQGPPDRRPRPRQPGQHPRIFRLRDRSGERAGALRGDRKDPDPVLDQREGRAFRQVLEFRDPDAAPAAVHQAVTRRFCAASRRKPRSLRKRGRAGL